MRKTLAASLLLLLPATALAADVSGIGPRFGFSSGNPDQLVIGGQLEIADVAPDLDLVPNADLGLGDDATILGVHLDTHYRFQIQGSTWSPYLGAGVGVYFIEFDGPGFGDSSDTEVGGAFILGAQVPTRTGSRFFTEIKLGLGDIPDFRLLGGFTFKM